MTRVGSTILASCTRVILAAFCDELRAKGVTFPVELKKGVGGSLLCYVAAPDGVSIELMQC
jgi:hypothetical protein